MRCRMLTVLALVAALLVTTAGAAAAGEGQDNRAEAVNTTDGSSLFDLAFDIRNVAGPVLDQTNSAVALASCDDCRTVAIAVQVLIVQGPTPDVITPTNEAVAVNEECTSCDTLASAHQIVIGRDGPVRLTREGREQIRAIEEQLAALEGSDASAEELQAQVEALVTDLETVLDAELVPAGRPGFGRPSEDDDRLGPRGPPSDGVSETDDEGGDDTTTDDSSEVQTGDGAGAAPSPRDS